MFVCDDIFYVGVNDHKLDLFESQFTVPEGMAYNSYVVIDEKIAVFDSVDINFKVEWLDNLKDVLKGRNPDYLIVQHMEPDHSASISSFLKVYPNATIVLNQKTLNMIKNFFRDIEFKNILVVSDGEKLSLGKHNFTFIFAPMVHWPEVMVTYDDYSKTLFSADAFGKFGANDVQDNWVDEARRFYFGIVAKYGQQVQMLLNKVSTFDIERICSLHGPIIDKNLGYYLNLYNTWSTYSAENNKICIAYTSVYGNTKNAVQLLCDEIKKQNSDYVCYDLARCDISKTVADAFCCKNLVLATTTYNNDVFPFMKVFVDKLLERGFKNKKISIIENGSWAPSVARVIKSKFENSVGIEFFGDTITIVSTMSNENKVQIKDLASKLCE